jgi:hypothetical protein
MVKPTETLAAEDDSDLLPLTFCEEYVKTEGLRGPLSYGTERFRYGTVFAWSFVMLSYVLITWMCLSVVTALVVGKFIALVERRLATGMAHRLKNPSPLGENSYTNHAQHEETVSQAVAL